MPTNLYELLGRPVVLLDTETTGLSPATDRVIEIAAIKWDANGRSEFQTIVRPEEIPDPLDPFVTERSGISREMIEAGLPSLAAFSQLAQFLKGVHLMIGHNVAFDLGFIAAEFDHHHLEGAWRGDFIDTRSLALFTGTGIQSTNRGGFPFLSTTLTDVMKALGITLEGAHRAMADIAGTEAVFEPLYRKALADHRPILNAMTHPRWLIAKGKPRPDYVPPRAIVYEVA